MREKFQGKKGFEVLRISPPGHTQKGICYSIAGKCDFSPLVTLDFCTVPGQLYEYLHMIEVTM